MKDDNYLVLISLLGGLEIDVEINERDGKDLSEILDFDKEHGLIFLA